MKTPLNSSVQFRIGDIIHPSPVVVLRELFEHSFLQGEVIAVTHDGSQPDNYLVIKVSEVSEPIIVPELKTFPSPAGAPLGETQCIEL